MTDDEVIRLAGEIVQKRTQEALELMQAETNRLHRKFIGSRKLAHDLGSPKPLTQHESLLLFALERNKYIVEGDSPNGARWNGSASCKHNARETVISMGCASRHDLLIALWAGVSGQDNCDAVQLTEQHLEGSLVQSDIRALWDVVRQEQEAL